MSFQNIDELQEREIVPGYKAVFVHSDSMTFAHWTVEPGAIMPEHSHRNEQVAFVVEGELELTIGNETKLIGPGAVAVVPSGVSHSAKAVTKCRIIDAFFPKREEYM